jgi:hypothetical protein
MILKASAGISIVASLQVTLESNRKQTNAIVSHLSPSMLMGIISSTLHFFS